MRTALIIGASRGIGLALARQYLNDNWRVLATARKSEDVEALDRLGAVAFQLDVNQVEAIAGFGWKLDDERIDVAVLNAGVFGPRHDGFPTEADFDQVMHTNVLAAMRLLPILGPLVCSANGKLAVISSRMASLALRTSPSGSLYRASKAALNSVLVDASLLYGHKGAVCVAFHPGWVRTDMGGHEADLDVEDSAFGLRQTIAKLNSADNGAFLNYDGQPLSW